MDHPLQHYLDPVALLAQLTVFLFVYYVVFYSYALFFLLEREGEERLHLLFYSVLPTKEATSK